MRKALLILSMASIACDEASAPTQVAGPTPSPALIKVDFQALGDTSLLGVGSPSYSIVVDNGGSKRIYPNESVTLTIPPGYHAVHFYRILPPSQLALILSGRLIPPPWCNTASPTTIADSFPEGSTSHLTFVVDCPRLEGTATLRLTLFASGDNAPQRVQTYLRSAAGPATTISTVVPTNVDTALVVRTGMYRLGIDAPGCQFQGGPYSGLTSPLMLRRDTVITLKLALPCQRM